jgi:hypothetical protein
MSEQETKCIIEDKIKVNHSGELQKNTLEFVRHMNATYDFVQYEDGSNGWYYMGERICFHVSVPNQFLVFFGHQSIVSTSECNDFPISDELKEFTYANVHICSYCGEELPNGLTIQTNGCREGDNIIFGKKYDNLCNCPIGFENPDVETFEMIKRLAGAWRNCIAVLKSREGCRE